MHLVEPDAVGHISVLLAAILYLLLSCVASETARCDLEHSVETGNEPSGCINLGFRDELRN